MFGTLLLIAVALCAGVEIGLTLHRRRRHHRPRPAQDVVLWIDGAIIRHHFTHCRGNSTMYQKGSIVLIAALATLLDRVTPGALAAGAAITLTPDNPSIGTLEQQDSTTWKWTFTDNGTVNFHGAAVNSDGNAIGSSQDVGATATDQAAQDIVLTLTAAPPAAPPADTGTGDGTAAAT
jgi:hypothetical protein